jgi:HD-GYP domain-containing protein (c-di-GMP phosphodiesterase class II)
MPVPICILDRQSGVYLAANQAYAALLGLKSQQLLHNRPQDLPATLDASSLTKILQYLELERLVKNQVLLLYTAIGQVVRVAVQAELVDYNGREAVLLICNPEPGAAPALSRAAAEERLLAAAEICRELAAAEDPVDALNRLPGAAIQLVPDINTVLVALYDPAQESFNITAGMHEGETLPQTALAGLYNPLVSSGLLREAVRKRQPLILAPEDELLKAIAGQMRLFSPGKIVQSVMATPMIGPAGAMGVLQANSYKTGPFHESEASLLSLIGAAAASAIQTSGLENNLQRTHADLTQTYDAAIDGWSRMLELRDFSTERHTDRVVSMVMKLGKYVGLNDEELLRIKIGARLHDIGKMGVPDAILLKPGPLDEREWRIMRKHPVYAYELLRPIPHFHEIIDIPYCHHEKWDGTGYPRRLGRDEIPLAARLFSIVDVWDALSSNRPYRSAWPQNKVLDYIHSQANRQFEPELTRAFLEIVKGKNNHHKAFTPILRSPETAF